MAFGAQSSRSDNGWREWLGLGGFLQGVANPHAK